jgi:hypothetical protein
MNVTVDLNDKDPGAVTLRRGNRAGGEIDERPRGRGGIQLSFPYSDVIGVAYEFN